MQTYIHNISHSLRNFKKINNDLYNFSCPYCGDSLTHKHKARGYIYQREGEFFYRCHNCDIGKKLTTFLADNFPNTYKEYLIDNLSSRKQYESYKKKEVTISNLFDKMRPISFYPKSKSYEYLQGRKIPADFFNEIYYVPNFLKFYTESVEPLMEEKPNHRLTDEDEKVIIPFLNNDKSLIGFQARRIDKSDYRRYINVILNKNHSKVYGLHRLNLNRQIYVVEGAFDSMFIPNCIAMSGTSVALPYYINNEIYIYDNENRNSYVVSTIQKRIKQGKSVVIFPKYIHQKDINQMILDDVDVLQLIKDNTFSGIIAQMKFDEWRKT